MQPVVIGAGIAGLSTAYYLSKLTNSRIILLEASVRPGGWIHSVVNYKGTVYELGPRTIRVVGHPGNNTLELIQELGLEEDLKTVKKSDAAARNRLLYVDGRLHSLPNSMLSLFKKVPPFSKPLYKSVLCDFKAPVHKCADDSLYNFVARRFGEELAELAISPLVCGICAGDARNISVNFLMSEQFKWEQQYGGVFKGLFWNLGRGKKTFEESELFRRAKNEKWSVWSLNNGLETLPKRILEHLAEKDNVETYFSTPCHSLRFTNSHVEMNVDGSPLLASHVFCAVPAYQAATLFSFEHKPLKDELSAIPYVTVAVVNLEFPGNVLPLEGFGFLVPPNQNLPILGVIFDTCSFPQEGKTVLTVMMGGQWFQQYFGNKPQHGKLLQTALKHVREILNIRQDLVDSNVNILKHCIPQYIVGHKARVERIRDYVSNRNMPITFVGSAYDGVGVNDVILSCRRAAEVVAPFL